jgi:hypothetical protein
MDVGAGPAKFAVGGGDLVVAFWADFWGGFSHFLATF